MNYVQPLHFAISASVPETVLYDLPLMGSVVAPAGLLFGSNKRLGHVELGIVKAGYKPNSWLDVFSNNVFITPSSIDGGVVSPGSEFEFEVWHSFGRDLDLQMVAQTGGADVILDGVSGGLVRPFVELKYKVLLDQTKQTDLRYSAGFTFRDIGTYTFNLTGLFASAVSESIDWSYPPSITHDYLTEIIETFDGSEQRISLRDSPRISMNFQYSLTDDQQYGFENGFMSSSPRLIVPAWPFQVHITSQVNAGADKIYLESTNNHLLTTSKAFIVEDDKYEIIDVKDITAGVLTCFFLVKQDFSERALVVPAMISSSPDESESISYTNDFDTHNITFRANEELYAKPAPLDNFERLDGKRILDVRPDRSQNISTKYQRLREHFDPQIGARSIYNRTDGTVRHLKCTYRFMTEDERQRFEDFAELHSGAQGEFYAQGPGTAFEIKEDILIESNRIVIKASGYSNLTASTAPAIAIRLYNNQVMYRKVISATKLDDGSESLILDQILPITLIKDIDYVVPVYLSRFASDTFTYSFDTTEVSSITKTIKQLIYADTATN